MTPVLDTSRTYAIALEGGGARGAYEIGVWRALDEAGIRYNAVSGTSVGALNGAMFAMGDRAVAENVWKNITMADVINAGKLSDAELKDLVAGNIDFTNIRQYLPALADVLRHRGLDASPLRRWIDEVIDFDAIAHNGCDLYITTLDVSGLKPLQIRINDLPAKEIGDMLFASAFHPAFRPERLGGRLYADGGFFDSTPIYPLIQAGHKDIIAVHLPTVGVTRPVRIPDDVTVTSIRTTEDLGNVLNFDAEQSRKNIEIGYYDALRVICGLGGKRFCVERTFTERRALDELITLLHTPDRTLRQVIDEDIPATARRCAAGRGADFYTIFLAALEERADALGLPRLRVVTDAQLLTEVKAGG